MKKITCKTWSFAITLLIANLFFVGVSFAQTNYYYRGSGNVTTTGSWSTNSNGIGGGSPGNFTSNNQIFNLRNLAAINLNASWTVSGTNSKIVVGDGTNACNFTVGSNFVLNGAVDVSAIGTITLSTTGSITSISFGTLAATSTVDFASASAQTIPVENYGNVIVSGAKGNNDVTFAGATTIAGNLTISATGNSGAQLIFNTSNSTDRTFTISGDYIQSGYEAEFGTGNNTTIVNLAGNFSKTGGYMVTTSANTNGKVNLNGANKNIQGTGGTEIKWVDFNVASGGIYNLNGQFNFSGTSGFNGVFTVSSGGTLNCGTNIITSATNFTTFALNSGGILGIGSTVGITSSGATGNVQTNTRTLNTGATYNYNGTSGQVTGNGLPGAATTVKINNAAGVTLSAALTALTTLTIGDITANSVFNDGGVSITSTGTLNLTSGTYNVGSAATGSAFPAFATRNYTAGTTVAFISNASQTIRTTSYPNLTFSGTGVKTPASGTITVSEAWSSSGGNAALNTNNASITVTGNIAGTGNIVSGSGTISIAGAWSNSGTFTPGSGTVSFNGGTQAVNGPATFNNLTLTGGTKTFGATTTINGLLSISATGVANLGTFTHSANTLSLNALGTVSGSWGSTSSSPLANNTNDTYFAASAGKINITNSSCASTSITLGSISAVCQTATSFSIPYSSPTGSPDLYSLSGTGITGITDAALPASPITANFTLNGVPPSMPFVITVKNSTTGCVSSNINGSVTVSATPTTSAAGSDAPACQNTGTTLTANTALAGTGAWTIPSGPSTSTAQITGGLNNAAATFTPTAVGTYTLRWTISSNPCTASFDDVVYTVNAQPQVSIFAGNAVCSGGIGQLTVTTSAGTGPFTVIYNPGSVSESPVTSGTPFNVTPNPGSTSNYTLTSITDNNGCVRTSSFTDNAATITIHADGTWVGTTTDWFTPSNWCGGAIPTAATDVVIPAGGTQPTINAAGAVCNNITIAGTLTFSSPGYLTVSGNFANNGTVTAGTGTTVEFNGGAQTVSGSSTTTFRNLTPNSTTSLSLNSNAAVAGTLSVAASKILIVNGTTLTINSGATGSVSGTLRNSGTVTATGTLTFNSGGTYDHTRDAGTIPTATWSTNSTCLISGPGSAMATAPGGNGQTFYNFTWASANTGQIDFLASSSINGSLTITNGNATVNNELRNATTPFTIGGDLSLSGNANLRIGSGTARTVTVNGDVSITGGTLNLSNGNQTGTLNVLGDFTHSAGTITETSTGSGLISFNGTAIQTYTSGGTVSNTVNFNVSNNAKLYMAATATAITGGGTFTIANGGTLGITSGSGITSSGATGNIQVTGTRTFNTGANYIYRGTVIQSTGNGLPATVNNLTIDNTGGTTGVTLTGNVTVNGILDFANGLLTTGANTVTIAAAGNVTNANSSRYVSGRLARAFTSATSKTFDIGTATNYRPAVFSYTAAPGTKTATIQYLEQALPFSFPASTSTGAFGTGKYWSVTQTAGGTAATVGLDNDGISQTAGATVQVVRSDNGATGTALAASFSSPAYTSAGFTVANTNTNYFALGETAIPLTINGVTVTATKVYDGNPTAVLNTGSASLSGVISPDAVTLNSGSAAGAYADKHVGTGKAITITGFTLGGANGGAYSLPTPNQISGLSADITVRPITVTAVTNTKTYDGTTSSAGVPTYTLQPGDATGTAPTQTFDDKHVGTNKVLTAAGLVINDGNSGNNYSINYATDNTGEIQVRNITVTAVTDTKFYDGNNSSTGVPTYTLQPGDATGTAPTQTFDNANVGTGKTLTASGLTINDGNSGNNYNIGYATNNTGVINQLAVTVTPDAGQFKVFGDSDPTFTYTASPSLISPDVFTGALSRNSGEALGFYNYTLGSLSAGGNYSLSLGGSNTFEIQAISQSNADFRSKANGNFSAAGTWEYDLGGGNWQNATQPPTSANSVSITHDVTLDQNYTVGASKTFALGTGAIFTVDPTRTFTIAGNADFTGKPVTIKSDNTGTGSLGQVTGTLTGATNVTVERYIPNNGFRSWRLLSVPTFGNGQTIKQAWQENQAALANGNPGFGTQITGPGLNVAASQALGFDNAGSTSSLLAWNGTGWTGQTTTLQAIAGQKAWFLYIRGERSKGVTGLTSDASATTLRTNGTVYTGDQVNTIGANATALIGNVYASAIDFTGLVRTGGVSNTFYIWDSKKLNGTSLGAYQTFSGTNGFLCLLSGGSYTLGQPNTTIESGQGFLVKSTAAGTLTLKESAKISGTNGNLGLRPSIQKSKIDSRLYNANNEMLDANAVVFDAAYNRAVDADDAIKFGNPGTNFAVETESKILAIEATQPPVQNDIVQFRMWGMQQQDYKLEFAAGNMVKEGLSAQLEDAYLHTSNPIDLSSTTSVNFTVDANAGSSAANRFKIVFKQSAPLPITFVSIDANRVNNNVKVDWKIAAERNMSNYNIERSADGRNFVTAGTVTATNNLGADMSYSFTDAAAPATTVFYRIKSAGTAGDMRYSPIVKVAAGNVKTGYAVSPNPVENGIMNLQFKNQPAGKYSVRILTSDGQSILLKSIAHAGGSSNQLVTLPETMARGTYQVEIVAPGNTRTIQTLFVNKK